MSGETRAPAVLGADVGGTFTDIVLSIGDDALYRLKVPSTPPDYGRAITDRLPDLLADAGVHPSALAAVLHGTTAATNAIVELGGARTALVTTRGFRDVLELARTRRPTLFDITWAKPRPLAERRLRFEVSERIDARGQVVEPLETDELSAVAAEIRRAGVESVAICLNNSHANAAHERIIAERLEQDCPGVAVSASCDVLPEIREYERTSTTCVNAYVRPLMQGYLHELESGLRTCGVDAELGIMQSNGGLMPAHEARRKPVYVIESGPAAGVTAALLLARQRSLDDLFAFDMGGTTAKATLIEAGQALEATEYEVGGPMTTNRLLRGGGYSIRTPSIDIAEVGAGGGSIFWSDRAGAPRVGPQSAGAVPGPACYGAGGEDCTVTDANVVLGYINPAGIGGGSQSVDPERAAWAVDRHVASALDVGRLEAAYGVHGLANSNMGKALRGVSMQRGRDPRGFALMAFGGSGPVHAVGLARAFHIARVIVPNSPGLLSAIGLIAADIVQDRVVSYTKASTVDVALIASLMEDMERDALIAIADGPHDGVVMRERFLDVRYVGQSFELRVQMPDGPVTDSSVQETRRRFDAEHLATYGHELPDEQVEIVNLRFRAKRHDPHRIDAVLAGLAKTDEGGAANGAPGSRNVYFGRSVGTVSTPVLTRWQLPGEAVDGPLLIEEMDSTTVVPPSCRISRDAVGSVIIDVPEEA